MPGPDVQQLPGGGGLTSYSFCTSPLYFAWVYLSYLMPSHFIVILSLSPWILFYFFRGSTPPARDEDHRLYVIIYKLYIIYMFIYRDGFVVGAGFWGFVGSSWQQMFIFCTVMPSYACCQRYCCKISSIWYIYICIPQKFHPAGSKETKHIAHAQRETT